MVVVEVLLACNLAVLVLCASRGSARRKPRLDDLLAQVRRPEPAVADDAMGVIVPFPGPDLARRRAMAAHPSAHSPQASLRPAHPSAR